jgi:hypothetical protein
MKPLFRESWDKPALRRRYPPVFAHPHKRLLHDIAFAPGEEEHGELCVSRWACVVPAGHVLADDLRVREEPTFFEYGPAPGAPSSREWYLNFADTELFFAYGGALFAQDEIQVAEHPVLASVREKLRALAPGGGACEPRTRDARGVATPVLVQGVERRIAVATDADAAAGRPLGLYGNRFATAPRTTIVRATSRIEQPTLSNILALAAPAYGSGAYSRETIDDALCAAFTGFRAAAIQAEEADRGGDIVVHTGNWGCGAFGGNAELMYLVQMVAAAWAGVGEIVFHAPRTAEFAMARTKFADLVSRCADHAGALQFLHAQRYRWGVSDGN